MAPCARPKNSKVNQEYLKWTTKTILQSTQDYLFPPIRATLSASRLMVSIRTPLTTFSKRYSEKTWIRTDKSRRPCPRQRRKSWSSLWSIRIRIRGDMKSRSFNTIWKIRGRLRQADLLHNSEKGMWRFLHALDHIQKGNKRRSRTESTDISMTYVSSRCTRKSLIPWSTPRTKGGDQPRISTHKNWIWLLTIWHYLLDSSLLNNTVDRRHRGGIPRHNLGYHTLNRKSWISRSQFWQ